MKEINLIKMFSSHIIYPSYISWFNLTNPIFFQGLFSQLNVSSRKGQNQDEAIASSCLMLATAP